MKRIYLAGFDVFREDALTYGANLKLMCHRYGFEGLYPLDNACPVDLQARAAAQWIYESNLALIRQADILMANLNDFRGHEPDSGTCFEIGFAKALNLPTWAYCSTQAALIEQVPHTRTMRGQCVDAQDYAIEDFGLPRNLMLSCSTNIVYGYVADCLAQIAAGERL